MRIFIALLVLIFTLQSFTKADDIKEFEIEGISIGDSALQYLQQKQILDEFERTKEHYHFLKEPQKFREAYVTELNNNSNYDQISFMTKENDQNYKIYFLRGIKSYNNKFDECIDQRNLISDQIANLFNNYNKTNHKINSTLDPSGKSYRKQIVFSFNSGDEIIVDCSNWDEKFRNKNNFSEGLSVAIATNEVIDWFDNR